MGKHGDDKDRSQKDADPSKWQKSKSDSGGKHGKDDPRKGDPKK